jgi:hypothetical protein
MHVKKSISIEAKAERITGIEEVIPETAFTEVRRYF